MSVVEFCPTWAVQQKQREERLKINHCWRATYIKLYSSFKMCFVHYIYVINVHLDFDSKVQFEKCNTLLSPQTVVELCHNGISYVRNSGQKQRH